MIMSKIQRMPQTAIGFVALVVAVCAFASRYLSITNHATFITAALSPYLMLCAPVSAALLTWGRHWILAIAAVGLTVAEFAVQLPLYLHSDARRTAGVEVRLMSANLYEGMADPDHLVRSAQAQADVIAFQELTRKKLTAFPALGSTQRFPTGGSIAQRRWRSRHVESVSDRCTEAHRRLHVAVPYRANTGNGCLDRPNRRRSPRSRSLAATHR